MINTPESYIVINEGTIVNIDPSSIYFIKNLYPSYVIFTELSGTSVARGMMRSITEIDPIWIADYEILHKKINLH